MKKIFLLLALSLSLGFVNAQNIQEIQNKARKGDAYSQYLMGYNYDKGINGAKQDYSQARYWFTESSAKGYGPAAYYMGMYYYTGEGVPQNYNEALNWFTKAYNLGMKAAREMIISCQSRRSELPAVADVFDPSNPPILELVANSFQFIDSNYNNVIDAGENCIIKFSVVNRGKGTARNCEASVFSTDVSNGLVLESKQLSSILPGEEVPVTLSVKANLELKTGKANLIIHVTEPHGLGTDPMQLSVNTKEFIAPNLQVVDYAITSVNSGILEKKQPFDMEVLLQNLDYGDAENVKIELDVPNGVIIMSEGGKTLNYPIISGGESKSVVYSLIVTDNFKGTAIPIDVNIKERYGKYAQSKHIELMLNQSLASNNIEVREKESESKILVIETASLTSDVDKNIPNGKLANAKNTFSVIIANEFYNKEANVPFASNDGKIFEEYCIKTIGLPKTNVHLLTNATLNDMKHEISWLKQVIETRKGEAQVIFYYSGHGIPDEKDRQAYLLPVDGYGSDVSTGYSLSNLFQELGNVPSKSVLVLLDACFSGAKREGDMLASARGVAIKAKQDSPKGNMIVLSASQGDETAYPYKEKGHGIFTYYLLKKLQDSKGDVTFGELADYVTSEVKKQSIVMNGKMQTPNVSVSTNLENTWRNIKLK